MARFFPLIPVLTFLAGSVACAGEQGRSGREEDEAASDASTDDEDDDVEENDGADEDDVTEPEGGAVEGGRDATLEAGQDAGRSTGDAAVDAALSVGADGGSRGGAVDGSSPNLRDAAADAATADAALSDAGAFARAFHIPLRVHRARSALTGTVLASILEEVNEIWWKQAAICFEIEVVRTEEVRRDGFDFWFHQSGLGCGANGNGVYCGDHDIHSLDAPNLSRADNAQWDTRQNPARTAAHELGHGLTLEHYNDYPDSNDSLMSSGRQGFKLHEMEIATARRRAEAKALANSTPAPCAAVPVVN